MKAQCRRDKQIPSGLNVRSLLVMYFVSGVVHGSQVVVPPKVNAVLGKNVTIGCTVELDTNLRLTQISWERKLPTGWVTLAVYNPTSGISIPPEYERRLSFRSPSPRDATIVLEDVGYADVGIYTCKVTTFPLSDMQAFTTVSVLGVIYGSQVVIPPKVNTVLGKNATLGGTVELDTDYSFTIPSGKKFIFIDSVVHGGQVVVRPKVNAVLGENVTLDCTVQLDMNISLTQISWERELPTGWVTLAVYHPTFGISIPPEYERRLSFRSPSPRDATIVLEDVDFADMGIYTCKVTTFPLGDMQAFTSVSVLGVIYGSQVVIPPKLKAMLRKNQGGTFQLDTNISLTISSEKTSGKKFIERLVYGIPGVVPPKENAVLGKNVTLGGTVRLDTNLSSTISSGETFKLSESVVHGSQVVVPPKVNAVLGKNVTLGCTVQLDTNLRLTQISWERKLPTGWVTLAVYNPTFGISIPPEYERRLSFRSPSPRDATIVLEDVGFADVGIYTCKVTTFQLGHMQAFTTVSVLVEPKVYISAGSSALIGGGNETTVATCIAERGRPPAEVSWVTDLYGTPDAHMQDDANGTTTTRVHYTWHPTRHAQGHTLTCVVKHPALHKDFRIPYTINVQFAPDIQVLGYDGDWYVGRENVRLQCQANANPPAHHFRWIRLNGEMPDGAQVLNNSLVFTKPLHKNDSGVYKCDVANDIGLQSRDIRIRIRDPPSTTTTPVRLLTADISDTEPGYKLQALLNSPTLPPLPEGSLGAIVGGAVGGALFLLLLLILARIYYHVRRSGATEITTSI